MGLLKNAIRNELAKETSSITGENKGQVLDRWNKEDLQESIEQGNRQAASERRIAAEVASDPEIQRVTAKIGELQQRQEEAKQEMEMIEDINSLEHSEKLLVELEQIDSTEHFKKWLVNRLEIEINELRVKSDKAKKYWAGMWKILFFFVVYEGLCFAVFGWLESYLEYNLSLLGAWGGALVVFSLMTSKQKSLGKDLPEILAAKKQMQGKARIISAINDPQYSKWIQNEQTVRMNYHRTNIARVFGKYPAITKVRARIKEEKGLSEAKVKLEASAEKDQRLAELEAKVAEKEKDQRIAELEAKLVAMESEEKAPKKESKPLFGSLLSGEGQPVEDKENG